MLREASTQHRFPFSIASSPSLLFTNSRTCNWYFPRANQCTSNYSIAFQFFRTGYHRVTPLVKSVLTGRRNFSTVASTLLLLSFARVNVSRLCSIPRSCVISYIVHDSVGASIPGGSRVLFPLIVRRCRTIVDRFPLAVNLPRLSCSVRSTKRTVTPMSLDKQLMRENEKVCVIHARHLFARACVCIRGTHTGLSRAQKQSAHARDAV